MFNKWHWLIILSLILSCGCEEEKPIKSDGELSEILESPEAGKIHGTAIGDDIQDVMKIMKPHIVSEMPDEITARIPLNLKDSTFYDIDYDFKSGKLYSIDLDIYPKNNEDCLVLFNEFKTYYNGIYGKCQEDDGFTVWYTKAQNGDDVEIVMMDESKSHKKPYLAITFYQEDGIKD